MVPRRDAGRDKSEIDASLCALHIVVSQHISTLPHALGTHILSGEHAQVKHSLFAHLFWRHARTSIRAFVRVQLRRLLARNEHADSIRSPLSMKCALEFSVHQRKHRRHGTRS
jgi:hypothetical protein